MSELLLKVTDSDALCAQMPDPQRWLSASEMQRLTRINAPKRRAHYLAGHWLARQLLATACRGDAGYAEDFPLRERPDQAPVVDSAEADTWQISISHSQNWVACALAPFALGLDLEQRRPRPGLLSMRHLLALHPDDAGANDDANDDELLLRWVAKESWIKQQQSSALPEQLLAIRLQSRSAEPADIRVLSTPDWHLGLACVAPVGGLRIPYLGEWRYFGV